MNIDNGIVLKNYHINRKKLLLLDAQRGKIEVTYREHQSRIQQLVHGAHINYKFEAHNARPSIAHINIMAMPCHLARTNISFFHMILELCHHFIPINSNTEPIFELVHYLFTTPSTLSQSAQYLALCRFFALVGMYPEELPIAEESFNELCYQSFNDTILTKKLDSSEHHMIQSWVLRCIDVHPKKNTFKTFFTLAKNGI